jgi:hypothetical protein
MNNENNGPTLAQIETEVAAAKAALKEASIAKTVAEGDVITANSRLEDAHDRLFKARGWLELVKENERCRHVQP